MQRDGSISRLVLQGLWSGAILKLRDQAGGSTGTKRRKAAPDELQALRSALSDRFGQGSREPLFVQTLQVKTCHAHGSWHSICLCAPGAHCHFMCLQSCVVHDLQTLALADRDSYVAPEQAASSALAANSLQAGILQVTCIERCLQLCLAPVSRLKFGQKQGEK